MVDPVDVFLGSKLLFSQDKYIFATEKHLIGLGAYGSGKTRGLVHRALFLSVTVPNNEGLIGRAFATELETTTEAQFFEYCHPSLIDNFHKKKKKLTIRTTGAKVSTIWFRHIIEPNPTKQHLTGLNLGWFALDQIEHMNRQGRLAGRLDTGRIGMAGHSYGARGTMAAAGQRMGVHGTRFKEPRIRAGVVLSPALPGGRGTQAAASGVYDAIGIPLLHITGTEDGMPLAGTAFDPVTRTLPFRRIDRTDQYLLVLDGATHDTFGGGRPRGKSAPGLPPGPERQRHERAVADATVLFFDAYLKDAPAARRRLHNGFAASLAPGDRFEVK